MQNTNNELGVSPHQISRAKQRLTRKLQELKYLNPQTRSNPQLWRDFLQNWVGGEKRAMSIPQLEYLIQTIYHEMWGIPLDFTEDGETEDEPSSSDADQSDL